MVTTFTVYNVNLALHGQVTSFFHCRGVYGEVIVLSEECLYNNSALK